MSKGKVLILTDSLGLARDTPEHVSYEDTWPSLVRKDGYYVHQVSIGGATSDFILKQIPYHKGFDPDIVIVQLGIVDCAPRFARKGEIEALRKIPFLGNKILGLLNKPFIRKRRRITYTSLSNFRKNVLAIKASFSVPVYFLTIVNASEGYEAMLSGITENINNYNRIILEIADKKDISLTGIEKQGVMSDFHHLNKRGHSIVSSKVLRVLNA